MLKVRRLFSKVTSPNSCYTSTLGRLEIFCCVGSEESNMPASETSQENSALAGWASELGGVFERLSSKKEQIQNKIDEKGFNLSSLFSWADIQALQFYFVCVAVVQLSGSRLSTSLIGVALIKIVSWALDCIVMQAAPHTLLGNKICYLVNWYAWYWTTGKSLILQNRSFLAAPLRIILVHDASVLMMDCLAVSIFKTSYLELDALSNIIPQDSAITLRLSIHSHQSLHIIA